MDALSHLVRVIRWNPLGIAAVIGSVVVASRHNGDAAAPLQISAVLLASAAGFGLDDSAAELLDASPATLLRRRLVRVAVVAIPTVIVWITLFWAQGPESAAEGWALTAMFSGLLGLSMGTAAVATRRTSCGNGGIVVGPALLIALFASTTLPPRWRPLPMGDIPGGWLAIDLRWTTAAVTGAAVFVRSSRDRAAPHTLRLLSRRVREP